MSHNKNMRQNKSKEIISKKNNQKFKELCLSKIKRQPPLHFMHAIKQSTASVDVDLLNGEQLNFFEVLLEMPFSKIVLFTPLEKKPKVNSGKPIYETQRFKQLLQIIGKNIKSSKTIKSFSCQNFPINAKYLRQLKEPLQQAKSLKELRFRNCSLTDQHIQILKTSLCINQSLMALDFSSNKLEQSGGMIGKILSEHSQRRNQIVWIYSIRGEHPQQQLNSSGICEIDLQNNLLNDHSATELITFLKDDNWTRCINLRKNKITESGVRKFAYMLKYNSSIISLDLRQNPGLTKQYSKYIYHKLVGNMQKYKTEKKVKKISHNQNVTIVSKKQQHYKSLEESRRKSMSAIKNSEIIIGNNATVTIQRPTITKQCKKCRDLTYTLLKSEKKNLDLELELKKVKHILLTKNIDISAIIPQNHHNSLASFSLYRQQGEDEDLIVRMEQVMNELTRIMEAIEHQHHTQTNINIDNPLSAANSLSNTIPLYTRAQDLQLSHQ